VLLGGAASAVILPLPAFGGGDGGVADPVFAVIEAHRAAERAWCDALAISGDMEDWSDEGRVACERTDALSDLKADAFNALLPSEPTTFAGFVALVSYLPTTQMIRDHGLERGELATFLQVLNASLVTARASA
jgi:hypothetical protein